MKTLPILLATLAGAVPSLLAADSLQKAPNEIAPPAGNVSQSLFWIADTRKMDAFLTSFPLAEVRAGAYSGEVLPDTRAAWRDYPREAIAFAREGKDAEAAARLAQMLKLAAVYRSFGGLQNVVQGEEIRSRAGWTAQKLGKAVTALIQSPFLEKDAGDCLMAIEEKVGAEKREVTPYFWRNFEMEAVKTHYRLSGGSDELATRR